MARLSILLLMCVMVVGCGTFEPKPGMTVKELNSMSALSFSGNIVQADRLDNIGVDIYETSNQNRRRVRNAKPPEGGWTFVYVRGGRVIPEQEVRNLTAEAGKFAQLKSRTTPGPVTSRSTSASNNNQRTSPSASTQTRAPTSRASGSGGNDLTAGERAAVCSAYHTAYAMMSDHFGARNDRDYSVDVALQLNARYGSSPGYGRIKDNALKEVIDALGRGDANFFSAMIANCQRIGAPAPLNTGR